MSNHEHSTDADLNLDNISDEDAFVPLMGAEPNPLSFPAVKQPDDKPEQTQPVGSVQDPIRLNNLPGRIRDDHGTGTYRKTRAFEEGLRIKDDEK